MALTGWGCGVSERREENGGGLAREVGRAAWPTREGRRVHAWAESVMAHCGREAGRGAGQRGGSEGGEMIP